MNQTMVAQRHRDRRALLEFSAVKSRARQIKNNGRNHVGRLFDVFKPLPAGLLCLSSFVYVCYYIRFMKGNRGGEEEIGARVHCLN
jgi:hypothetical protein